MNIRSIAYAKTDGNDKKIAILIDYTIISAQRSGSS